MHKIGLTLFVVLFLAGCTAIQQQKAQPARPDDLHFHNLQVLPQNIPRAELIEIMKSFTRALGVRCQYCHVQTATAPDEQFDFASDAKREKANARVMMRMTQKINADYIPKVAEAHTVVTCWTCHRGEVVPDIQPSVPAPAAAQPRTLDRPF